MEKNLKFIVQIVRAITKMFRSNTQIELANTNITPYRKFGFTLSEVLITLAVIGIVAALTIPTLVQS